MHGFIDEVPMITYQTQHRNVNIVKYELLYRYY